MLDVGVVVDLTDDLFCVPCEPHLASWVAGGEQPHKPFTAIAAQSFGGHHQQPSSTVERVVFAAAVTEQFVLHPPPAFVQRRVPQTHDMERISDLDVVRQHRVEHAAIRVRQIQRCPANLFAPAVGAGCEPCTASVHLFAVEYIGQLTALNINNLGGPPLTPIAALAHIQRLVQTNRVHGRVAARISNQRFTEQHHRVPITPQIRSHFRHRPAVPADLHGCPPGSPGRHRATT